MLKVSSNDINRFSIKTRVVKKLTNTFLLICIFSYTLFSQITNGSELDIPLITIEESEIAYAEVDEIHFSVTIQSYAKEIHEARNKNRKIAETLFAFLKSKNISDRYIQTKRMRISRNYVRNRHPVEFDGFNAHQVVYVCLKDINAYDGIIDHVLQMDVQGVNGPDFKSSNYDATLKEARLKALKKAKVSASEMAAALGQSIGPAQFIDAQVTRGFTNNAYSSDASTSEATSNRSFEIGELEIRASVKVSFALLQE